MTIISSFSDLALTDLEDFILHLVLHHQKILSRRNGIFGIIGIALDIAFGIYAINLHNMAHCDVKPENCLVFWSAGNQPIVKLANFGCLVEVPPNRTIKITKTNGTSAYIPPETVERNYGLKTDVYSLALTAIDLIHTGFGYEGGIGSDSLSQDRHRYCPPVEACSRTSKLWPTLLSALEPYESRISLVGLICKLEEFLHAHGVTRPMCRQVMAKMFRPGSK
jgi:serine/threonine protein kinase